MIVFVHGLQTTDYRPRITVHGLHPDTLRYLVK